MKDPLPEEIFGIDTDELLGYTTKKIVWIRDRWIGLLYYFFIFLIVCWVIGFQILYGNEHFTLKDVEGTARVALNQPTYDMCNSLQQGCKTMLASLKDLPYCKQSGPAPSGIVSQQICAYMDRHSILPQGAIGNTLFIPTFISRYPQRKMCEPDSANGYSCESEYETDTSVEPEHFFVADVDDFLVTMSSTYNREDIVGSSLSHQGYYVQCDREMGYNWKQRIENAKPCPDSKRERVRIPCAQHQNCVLDPKWEPFERKTRHQKEMEEELKMEKDEEKVESKELRIDDDSSVFLNDGVPVAEPGRRHHAAAGALVQSKAGLRPDAVVSTAPAAGAGRSLRMSSIVAPPVAASGSHNVSSPDEQAKLLASKPEKPEKNGDGVEPHKADVFGSEKYDSFRVKKLLELVGLDLDKSMNPEGVPIRLTGAVLEVQAYYKNTYAWYSTWGKEDVKYSYIMSERPIPETSQEIISDVQPEDYPRRRVVEVRNGILISFSVAGSFGFFNIVYLLVMLTTSLALLATATTVTDLIAVYLHPRKRNYFHLKYEVSPDFSDAWMCPKCNYYNSQDEPFCQGTNLWEDKQQVCGEPRPEEEEN
eukprot:gnl/TRDRNA2_/TRDRNA2_80967_c0_seq1.p1 gnl/TRDRNA2_/TRDRNA2_80967_c0~~gnl/TRDRNA2_/TRDRNA2_80967_c0_seq1.p1  ORF type:complete len:592 (-),score=111.62 gnl/TRDRNA2_/TRDRNA2_80967_c0_seq1:257-2032(-)